MFRVLEPAQVYSLAIPNCAVVVPRHYLAMPTGFQQSPQYPSGLLQVEDASDGNGICDIHN